MEDHEWLLFAIGAYTAYTFFNSFNRPLDKVQTANALRNAGATPYETANGTFVQLGNDTFKIPQEGWKLNAAQKFLIGIDRWIPGTWITRQVLT